MTTARREEEEEERLFVSVCSSSSFWAPRVNFDDVIDFHTLFFFEYTRYSRPLIPRKPIERRRRRSSAAIDTHVGEEILLGMF